MTNPATSTRGFQLIVEAADTDTYGLTLLEIEASGTDPAAPVAQVRPGQVGPVADSIHNALRESRQPRTALSAGRRKPIALTEPAGVRLALALLAAEPINKPSRRDAILAGVAAMSTEETYYWFAKTTGPAATRARRALRILLSDDGRTGLTA